MCGKKLNPNENYLFWDQAPQPDCGVLKLLSFLQSVCISHHSSSFNRDYIIWALKMKNNQKKVFFGCFSICFNVLWWNLLPTFYGTYIKALNKKVAFIWKRTLIHYSTSQFLYLTAQYCHFFLYCYSLKLFFYWPSRFQSIHKNNL